MTTIKVIRFRGNIFHIVAWSWHELVELGDQGRRRRCLLTRTPQPLESVLTGLQGSYGFSKFSPIVEPLEMLAECGQPNSGVCVLSTHLIVESFENDIHCIAGSISNCHWRELCES